MLKKLLNRIGFNRLYLRVVFKGGHVEDVRVAEYSTNPAITKLTWTDYTHSKQLIAFKPEEVAALFHYRKTWWG